MSCNIKYEELIFSVYKMSRFNDNEYYVFTGIVDPLLANIFKKLENRNSILKDEVLLLRKNYKDYYEDWVNIVKKKIKIKFIPAKIEIDDSINEIRKKIFIYLSTDKNYILPENQELWLEKNDGTMEIIGYYYDNVKTKEKEFTLPHIYEKMDTTFDYRNTRKNTSENNMLIYDLLENDFKKKVIYLSDAKDEEKFIKSKLGINDTVINKYFKKYWPYVNLTYIEKDIKNDFLLLQNYYSKENYIFQLMTKKESNTFYGSCNILTAKLTTMDTFEEEEKYIDLYPIFDYIRENMIDEKTPFLKYYENSIESPFSIISKKAIENNKISKKILKDWLNLKEDTYYKKKNDIIVKRYLKDYNEPRYYHIAINKMGIVRINISFDNDNNANFTDIEYAIKDCKKFIENINKNRITTRKDEIKKINYPDMNIVDNKVIFKNNTKMIFMNIIIPLKLNKPIDFKKLSEFSKKFPYFLVPSDDKNIEKSLNLKYKRVSGFANMNDILYDIDKLKEIYDKDTGIIVKMIEKKYQKTPEEIKGYLLEWERKYSSSKSTKISSEFKKGILVKINDNNILFNGITRIYQIPLIYKFFNSFLNLFFHYDDYLKDKNFKKIFSSNINYNYYDYEIDKDAKVIMNEEYNIDYDDYYLDDFQNISEEYEETKEIKKELTKNIIGLSDNVDSAIALKCEDKIPEKDTCGDFCNDEKYFLRRLQIYDNKLFRIKNDKKNKEHQHYARKCSRKTQPVVMGYDPATNDSIKRESYTYSIKYSSDPNTFNRWYICPKVWCPYCEIPILQSDIDPKTIRTKRTEEDKTVCKTGLCPYGDHQVFIKEQNDIIYPGFLTKSTHPDGLCMPCCFINSHMNPKSTYYSKLKKCLGEEIEDKVLKNGKIYILGKGIPIDKDRYGRLPVDIARILKTNLDTGDLEYKSGYLRKGIKHINNNSFLSCITDILSCDKENVRIDVNKLKKTLIEKLNEDLFKSLHNGNLENIFGTIDNFKNYILNEKIEITHAYLWDYLQRKNILFENGVNIFIFENNNLLCPKGENINYFYDYYKKSILIIKSKEYYEPIYYLEGQGKSANKKCIFDNEREEIKKLFEIAMEGCTVKSDIDWLRVLKDNIQKYNLKIDNIIINDGTDLQTTLNELLINIKNKKLSDKFIPILQYIDSYNKVFGILLKNGLYLPVASSKLIEQLKYKVVHSLDEVNKLSMKDTIKYNDEISDITNLKCKIISKILDLKYKKKIIALVNENNRFIAVKEILNTDKSLKISNLNYYINADQSLHDKIENIDERAKIMNMKKFEDESFIRLKFELSKFLHMKENKKYLDDINDIISSTEKNGRSKMYVILNNIYNKIVFVGENKNNLYNYKTPNKRTPCLLINNNINLSCDDDPHCTFVDKRCKLFINRINLLDKRIDNYNYYLSKIIDELLRFKLKRDDILNDNIPTIIDKELVDKSDKYIIIHTMNFNEINNIVDQLYFDNKGINIDTRSLYEDTYTEKVSFNKEKYIKSNKALIKNNKNEELPIFWLKLLGNKFKIKLNKNDIFTMFVKILNSDNIKNNIKNNVTIQIIKNKLIESIKKKNEDYILDLYKREGDKIFKYITSYQSLLDEIANDTYYGSKADLYFISQIININIILLDKRIKKNQKGYQLFKSTKSDYYIILYNSDTINIISEKNKLIFKITELPDKFINFITE